jgi:replication factor C small subunit
MYRDDEFIWSQKYRPRTVADCILPEKTKQLALEILETGKIPNLLLAHPNPGIGKTTLAIALCEELEADYLVINSSLDANIDTLRYQVNQFASTVSLTGGQKVVIWEEADAMPKGTQDALRAFMEEFSTNCTHILTANYKQRILPAIQSRCSELEYSIPTDQKPKIAGQISKRIYEILEKENVTFDKKVVNEIILKKFPDFRNMLNILQTCSAGGELNTYSLVSLDHTKFDSLIQDLKNKKFSNARKWLVENSGIDATTLFDNLYKSSVDYLEPSSVAELILILAKYQANVPFVANQEINTAACLTEIMLLDGWK